MICIAPRSGTESGRTHDQEIAGSTPSWCIIR